MSQAGLHGLAGVYLSRVLCQRRLETRGQFRFGLVVGLLLPDIDFYPLAVAYLFDPRIALAVHRSFTHSLVAVLAAVALTWLVWRRRAHSRALALGVGAGFVVHIFMDILTWFGGVDLFWPLGMWGIARAVNIWTWFRPPALVSNLLGAADYLCFGLYYALLGRMARAQNTDAGFTPKLPRFAAAQWVMFLIFVVLACRLPSPLFDLVHYAFFIAIFFPMALYITARMRLTIAGEGS